MSKAIEKISSENNLTVFECKGDLEFKELAAELVNFYGNVPTANIIFDARSANFDPIESDQVDRITTIIGMNSRKRPGPSKTAFVVSGPLEYGLLRMVQIHSEIKSIEIEYEIFKNIDDAKKWLKKGDL